MAEEPQGSDGKRKRFQQLFAHANKAMSKDDFDYATNLLTQCVLGDPGNLMYFQTFLGNLKRKYQNNKKGAGPVAALLTVPRRALLKKAALRKNWDTVIKHGLAVLKVNPWSAHTLIRMAEATRELGFEDVELACLKGALEPNPKDVPINRFCARALGTRKLFDQADLCWRRVLQVRPKDEEAQKAIGDLAVEKTIAQGGYEEKDAGAKAVLKGGEAASDRRPEETEEAWLMRSVRRAPKELAPYVDLANFYAREEQFDKAEKVLLQADKTMPGNSDLRERLEDVKITRLRHQAAQIRSKLETDASQELEKQLKKLQDQLNCQEIQAFKSRCERAPNNLQFRYELGLRYQRAAQFKEAIVELQRAKLDPRRKGVSDLALGQCFVGINQLPLALEHFSAAAATIPEHDLDHKKEALYLAGTTAISLKKKEAAIRYLTNLAGLDYGYRDVSALLDKVAQFGDDDESDL